MEMIYKFLKFIQKKEGASLTRPNFLLLGQTHDSVFELADIHSQHIVLFTAQMPFMLELETQRIFVRCQALQSAIGREGLIHIIIDLLDPFFKGIGFSIVDVIDAGKVNAEHHNVYLHTLLKYPEAILPSYFTIIICAFF